jgi:threonine dehydratase
MISLDDVRRAARRLDGVAHRTPVLRSATLDRAVGATILCKGEHLQRGGAFKLRGAYNAMASLDPDVRDRGVVAFSSGNHAQAVAIAGRLLGTTATIVMPEDTPSVKVEATEGYGAEVVTYDRYREDREVVGARLAEERSLTLIPPYEHPQVMAGQGTVALELLEEAGQLDVLLVCVGGGGLIAGCGTAAKGLDPSVRVVGVEPEAGDDTRRSLAAGERVRIPVPRTIADGQQADIPGAMTFAVNQQVVDEVVTVTDEEILDAMVFAFDRMKAVLEPSGACALAAVLAGRLELGGARVGVTLTGGNVGVARFCDLMATRAP